MVGVARARAPEQTAPRYRPHSSIARLNQRCNRRSAARKVRDLEALAVRAGRHPRHSLEQTTKEGRVLVADLPADLVDGCFGAFQPPFRVLDAQALDVE